MGYFGNPYVVIGNLRVPPNSSLIIQEGCQIVFAGHYRFVVDTNAQFLALGTMSDPIKCTAMQGSVDWNGLRFYAADTSYLSYCTFEYGKNYFEYNPTHPYCGGGAVYCESTPLTIVNCQFRYNLAPEGIGGAIYAEFSPVNIKESNISSNYCGRGGAAISLYNCNTLIENCIISKDSTYYRIGGERAGAILIEYCSEVELLGNSIMGNFSGHVGGGLTASNSNIILSNNLISRNRCLDSGAGAAISHCQALIVNNVFDHNEVSEIVGFGGGALALGMCQSVQLINNTIIANSGHILGGGINSGRNDSITIVNNIIRDNVARNNPQIYIDDTNLTCAYNNIEGSWQGIGNIDADPLFANPTSGD